MKWVEKENIHTNRIHQRWMLDEILRLQCKERETKPSFKLNADVVNKLSDLLLKHNRIHQPVGIEKLTGGKP